MGKILVLELDNEYKMMRNTFNCDFCNYFKYSNKNIIQKIMKKSMLLFSKKFLGNWSKKICEYDMCILFDRGFNKLVTKFIKAQNPSCKTILWLWNPISNRQESFMSDKNIDEIWTYDINDSRKYNIKFNTQFYNKELVNDKCKVKEKYDIMFIGNNKGRNEIISRYKCEFDKLNLKSYIKVIDNYKENIKYEEYLNYLMESKALLEIVKEDVSGITLRALEGIFFGKKLITNNKFIKMYDFYNPNNIFILEDDNLSNLKNFISSEYETIDKTIIDYYDFEEWVNRFYKGE